MNIDDYGYKIMLSRSIIGSYNYENIHTFLNESNIEEIFLEKTYNFNHYYRIVIIKKRYVFQIYRII